MRRGTASARVLAAVVVLLAAATASALPPAPKADGPVSPPAPDKPPAEWVVHDWSDRSLEPGAALGDPYALFVVGRKYMIDAANREGEDTRRIGLEYLEWSAKGGFAPADRFLAAVYLAGTGVPRDPARGVAYLEHAAAQGDAAAQRRLGDLYFEGREVAPDPHRALLWYQRVLASPESPLPGKRPWEVALRLARLHLEPGVPDADPAQARRVLEQAAERYPVGPVLKALADSYAQGPGAPTRPRRALATYDLAAAAYLDHGLGLGIEPAEARGAAAEILGAMERLDPRAAATRALRLRIQGDGGAAAPPAQPGAPAAGTAR